MKKGEQRRLQCGILALLILLLASCGSGDGEGGKETESTAENTVTNQETETETEAGPTFLPEGLKYDGEKYSILYAQNVTSMEENEITYPFADLDGGDIISESVYNRTRLAEEKLGISVVSEHIPYDQINTVLTNGLMAGSCDFEALCGRLSDMASSSVSGTLYDVKKIETLDLTHSWWDQSVNDGMTLAGKQYIFSGDINYYDDYAITCMVFNKRLFEDRQIEEPYQLVKDGKWTLDAFSSIVNDAAIDVNGDGEMDENDSYGHVANCAILAYMLTGTGETFTRIDDSGNRVLNMSENILSKAQNLAERYLNNPSVCIEERKLGYEKGDLLFPQGKSLMASILVGVIVDYRSQCEDDFGVIPFPKYDEAQSGYHSLVNHMWASAVAVPAVCADTNKVGYVLDTLGYYSPDTVTNAVIEKNIYTRSARDEESGEMLRMIFASKVFETSIVYNWGIYGKWCDLGMAETPDIVSAFTASEESINKTIADCMQSITENP